MMESLLKEVGIAHVNALQAGGLGGLQTAGYL